MGILGKRKNKKYDYQPRYYRSEDGSRPFEIKGRFDEHRSTLGSSGLKTRFQRALNDYKTGTDAIIRKRIYIIAGILIFLFLWFIDFDLSIFKL